jgi:hypothetical protein
MVATVAWVLVRLYIKGYVGTSNGSIIIRLAFHLQHISLSVRTLHLDRSAVVVLFQRRIGSVQGTD